MTPADRRSPSLPPGAGETIDAATAAAERVMLGLRLDGGIPGGAALAPPLAAVYDWASAAQLLAMAAGRIVLTTRGRLLSNELFARLV